MNHVLKSINQTTKNHQKPPKKPNKLSFGHQVAIPNLRQRYGEFRAEGSYIMLDIYIYILYRQSSTPRKTHRSSKGTRGDITGGRFLLWPDMGPVGTRHRIWPWLRYNIQHIINVDWRKYLNCHPQDPNPLAYHQFPYELPEWLLQIPAPRPGGKPRSFNGFCWENLGEKSLVFTCFYLQISGLLDKNLRVNKLLPVYRWY
jgi:hypothetical protein